MTRIIRNPAIRDSIVEISLSEPDAESRVRRHYENGDLVILRGFRFDLDYPFLASLSLDVEGPPEYLRKLKKFPMERLKDLQLDTQDPFQRFILDVVFAGDVGRLKHFREQAAAGDAQIHRLYKRLFPGYEEYKAVYTWRFTETMFENMHWDNFPTADDFHQVRVFANLDSRPRLWNISERIDTFADRQYDALNLGRFAAATPDRFPFDLNNRVLGGLEAACLDNLPRHHIAFEPGDVWLCETRLVSHQIYSGYRASAAMFYVKPESMDDPSLRFHERIRRVHAEHAPERVPLAAAAT